MSQRRPELRETFLDVAAVWAKRSTCSSRARVGCVLVNPMNQIIASGFNGSPRGMPHCDDVGCLLDDSGHCMVAIHAEENAILQCAMGGVSTVGTFMYVTHSPCPKCALRIIQAGIAQVVYSEPYKGLEETLKILSDSNVLIFANSTYAYKPKARGRKSK